MPWAVAVAFAALPSVVDKVVMGMKSAETLLGRVVPAHPAEPYGGQGAQGHDPAAGGEAASGRGGGEEEA